MDSLLLIRSKNALIYANYIRSSESVSVYVFWTILRIIEFKIFFLSPILSPLNVLQECS